MMVAFSVALGLMLVQTTAATAAVSTPEWWPLRGKNKVGCARNSPGSICGGSYHSWWAIDIEGPKGQAIYASGSGKASIYSNKSTCTGAGKAVVVDHGRFGKSYYGHLSSISIRNGQAVTPSTMVGKMGSTGLTSRCSYVHLHYEESTGSFGGSSSRNPGVFKACHGSKLVQYPNAWGRSSWNGLPSHTYVSRSDGTGCSKPKPKPKPKPKQPAPPATGDSTGYYEPGPAGWHLSNGLAPGPSNYIFARGKAGVIPVVGDWNGDGKGSTGLYFPWDRSWHLRNELSAGSSQYIFARGEPGSIPVVGDWNGDGKDSTGAYYPWDQTWHLRNELSAGSSQYIFKRGQPNSIPVVGDWNGDGKDSTGVFFPWDNSWHLRNELNAGPSQYAFVRGQPNSIPVVGDWNGDGKDSTGVFFPWDNSWHLRNELNPGPSQYAFARAASGSIPVVGNWDGK